MLYEAGLNIWFAKSLLFGTRNADVGTGSKWLFFSAVRL
jgi:hypothetical protein